VRKRGARPPAGASPEILRLARREKLRLLTAQWRAKRRRPSVFSRAPLARRLFPFSRDLTQDKIEEFHRRLGVADARPSVAALESATPLLSGGQ